MKKRTLLDSSPKNKKVLLRLDLNVPLKGGVIKDETRIVKSLETINHLLNSGNRLIVLSHLGRVASLEDRNNPDRSLKMVSERMVELLPGKKILFLPETSFERVKEVVMNGDYDLCILENTRFYDVDEHGEVIKWESKNNPSLSEFYASLADVFINDAFGTAHRAHASNAGVSSLIKDSSVGFLVNKELEGLNEIYSPKYMSRLAILGGSKVSDKLNLIQNLAPKFDRLIIGGAMSYTFLLAMGHEVGSSMVEKEMIGKCNELLAKFGEKIILPIDHIVSMNGFEDVPGVVVDGNHWEKGMALDIGPKSISLFSTHVSKSDAILWNGPMGVFEFKNYCQGTNEVACSVSQSSAYSVVGGGDSVSAVNKNGKADQISFISTGGGASLTFFEGGELIGLSNIQDSD